MNVLLIKTLPMLIVILFVFIQNFLPSNSSKEWLLLASYSIMYCSLIVKKPYMNIVFLFVIGLFIDSICSINIGFSSIFMLINVLLIRYQETTFKINNNVISAFLLFIVNMFIILLMINILNITLNFQFINSFDFVIKYTTLFIVIMPIFLLIYKVIIA